MLKKIITDHRAWTAATLDDRRNWYHAAPASVRSVIARALSGGDRADERTHWAPPVAERAALVETLEPVRAALEAGRGFAILTESLPDGVQPTEARAIYWLLGSAVGAPFAQNVQGTLLYDVRDTGQTVAQGARFSVTNAESSFHTDNSFGSEVVDYVGLLCLRAARAGGINQVVSAYTVHNILLESEREALETLYEPFHVDRRGGVQAGEAPTVLQPIFEWDGEHLIARYLRYWIEAGHEKAVQPLTAKQVRALDILDQTLRQPGLSAEFALGAGEIWFMNNRWLLHNRTAFEDDPDPERQRHLIRLWLKASA
jgi:alpha-ketoglutarate-dependent taurine dioxygenase